MAVILINSAEQDILLESSQIKMFLPEGQWLINIKSKEEYNLDLNGQLEIKRMTAEIFLLNK